MAHQTQISRKGRVPFRRDDRGVEGFMTEIPALAMIVFAITAFMISAVSASSMYLEDRERSDALDKAKDISIAIRADPTLIIDGRNGHFSAEALDDLVEGNLSLDLRNTGDMTVVVTELDQGQYNGTGVKHWRYSNTDRHDVPRATVSNTVLVGHWSEDGPPIYYIAYMEVRTW